VQGEWTGPQRSSTTTAIEVTYVDPPSERNEFIMMIVIYSRNGSVEKLSNE
jgi:hypothetical protein